MQGHLRLVGGVAVDVSSVGVIADYERCPWVGDDAGDVGVGWQRQRHDFLAVAVENGQRLLRGQFGAAVDDTDDLVGTARRWRCFGYWGAG